MVQGVGVAQFGLWQTINKNLIKKEEVKRICSAMKAHLKLFNADFSKEIS